VTQIGESLGLALATEFGDKCPFKEEGENTSDETENIPKDDVTVDQDNNGGTLGKNLEKGGEAGWGAKGSWNRVHPPSTSIAKQARKNGKVTVKDHANHTQTRAYDYTVAAHHLIPGEAALRPSHLYEMYMKEKGKIDTGEKTFTIKANIGYNVNGNHNGIWLPGNYAIREAVLGGGKSWSDLSNGTPAERAWCLEYAMACIAAAQGQFHDAHTSYNENAKAALDTIAVAISLHFLACKDCESKTDIYPPYRLKDRLYGMSEFLRAKVRGVPPNWHFPWYTSDRFKRDLMLLNPTGQPPGV
jgi:hypothetical protein